MKPARENAPGDRNRRSGSRSSAMTDKPKGPTPTPSKPGVSHPGMMGDGTQEQNLGEKGNPDARIKKDEVDAAFAKDKPKKPA
jgi:hypothetical protein